MLEDSLSADRKKEIEEHMTAMTIYATAHKVRPTLFVAFNAPPLLLPLTANMIFTIGRQCSENFTQERAFTFMKLIADLLNSKFIIGGLIPDGVYCCNIAWQNFAGEILGWIIFIMIRDESDREESLSFLEKRELVRKAAQLRNRNNEFVENFTEAKKNMSPSEQKIFDDCLKTLADEHATFLQRRAAVSDVQNLLKPYEIIF